MLHIFRRFAVGALVLVLATLSGRVYAVIGADESLKPEQLVNQFPEIVRLQSATEICTGTIIGPRVVLSAAHCADLKDAFFIYQGQKYSVTYKSSRDYKDKEHDVAVAITEKEIKGARFGLIGKGLRHGARLLLAGFGCTKPGGKSGSLNIGTTTVIGLDQDHVLSTSKKGGTLCQGDSGGPAFLQDNEGKHVVVAVNSASDIKSLSLNVRLDSDLSRRFLKRVADQFKVAICGVTMDCLRGRYPTL